MEQTWCNKAGLRSTEQAKEKVQRNWGSSVPSEAVVYTIKTIYLLSHNSFSSPLTLEKKGKIKETKCEKFLKDYMYEMCHIGSFQEENSDCLLVVKLPF